LRLWWRDVGGTPGEILFVGGRRRGRGREGRRGRASDDAASRQTEHRYGGNAQQMIHGSSPSPKSPVLFTSPIEMRSLARLIQQIGRRSAKE
jgi:hypothetical protein